MSQDSLTQQINCPLTVSGAEILTAPDRAAPEAAALLGWDGVVLPAGVLVGRRVAVAAELIPAAHEYRTTTGWGPVTDRLSVTTWSWPEMTQQVPPVAVRLHGVIAPARHWRTGLAGAVPFAGLCATAMLLPPDVGRDVECLRRADQYGCSVLATTEVSDVDPDAVDLVQPGRSGPALPAGLTPGGRLVHELVYEQLLATVS
ncbi:MAG: hypothetical protein GEU83_19715 [Pseudonocardiaceae bacterium]|nr:hypothetical protein [Pseudonocardiaceae bacterium]